MKKPVKPEKLKRGDCVGVVAPAGCVEPKQLERGIRVIEKMGLKHILGKYILGRYILKNIKCCCFRHLQGKNEPGGI